MGADVRDVALTTGILAGRDPADPSSLDVRMPDLLAACERGVRGMRVGLLAEVALEAVEPGVAAAIDAVAAVLRAAGAEIVTVSVPLVRKALAAYQVLAPAEASSNLARYDGLRYGAGQEGTDILDLYTRRRSEGLGAEVKRRILLGTFVLSAGHTDRYYARALALRRRLTDALTDVLDTVDLLLTPTSPTVAFLLGERAGNPLAMSLSDVFTVPASLAGLPAISVPCGRVAGLPVGAQLTGRRLDEASVFAAAAVVEAAFPCP